MARGRRRMHEAESGTGQRYSSAFTHPDPMDPNDRQRQRTQARSSNFPYDMDTMYGSAEVPDDSGAARQVGYGGQLTPWFVKDDDGDIEKEASETPYNFGRSAGGNGLGGLMIPGQSRGFAGSDKDDMEVHPQWDTFGEGDLHDLQTGELRDVSNSGYGSMGGGIPWSQVQTQPAPTLEDGLTEWDLGMDEDLWPEQVRGSQLRALEDYSLGECFAVYNEESDEVRSLLETLDWEG